MKRLMYTVMLVFCSAMCANATVLFPHFVDIAPNYEDGLTEELHAVGVPCGLYHSTTPGFMTSNFTEVEQLYKETLPNDVVRSEQKVGDQLLVTYTSVHKNNDVMQTSALQCTIYVLRRPDDSFAAAYCEKEMEP